MQNTTRENITLTGAIVGIALAVITINEKFGVSFKLLPFYIHPSMVIEILNILVLSFFFVSLKAKKLELNNTAEVIDLSKRLGIENENYKALEFTNEKVNKLVDQICRNLVGFISLLIPFFIFTLLKDSDRVTYDKWNSPYPFMDSISAILNAGSAAFIYLSFSILYNTTLDGNNRTSNYYRGTLLFLGVFVLTYLFLLGYFPKNQERISNIFKLLCGIYNGLAMGLLFGRITAMEFYFKSFEPAEQSLRDRIYKFGVTFILPIYVLSQPMYAILEFPQFRSQEDIFKSLVFLVCFIGKGFFLLFITTRVNNRLLHVYLHLSLADYKRSRSIIDTISKHKWPPSPESGNNSHPTDISGKYKYTCTQRGELHSHGGDLSITPLNAYPNMIEWRAQGARTWIEKGGSPRTDYDTPYLWESRKGVIFSDNSYTYSYHITTDKGVFGFSWGNVIFSEDKKEIIEFRGTYYQQSGNNFVWGTESIKRIGTGKE